MEELRNLVARRNANSSAKDDMKKDKLAESKRADRERKERTKADLKAAKAKKRENALQDAVKHREERVLSGAQTKRASKDMREAGRREALREGGSICDHGIWKCQICHPNPHTGKVNHHKDAPAAEPLVFAN